MTKLLCLGYFILALTLTGCGKKKATDVIGAPTVSEKAVGVPFYPGSGEWGTGSAETKSEERALTSSSRETSDAPEKVIAYYQKNLKDAKMSGENLGDIVHTSITGKAKDGSEAEVVVMKMPNEKTQIFLSVTRATASPSTSPH
ncbi:MAG: hypothetical protein ACXWHF_06145 [Chthoniobacterales bacterium]